MYKPFMFIHTLKLNIATLVKKKVLDRSLKHSLLDISFEKM